MAPFLVPTDPELRAPVLRHPDLQPNNIFISDDYRITSLIDWQHAMVLSAYLGAGIPKSFQNYNDPESQSFTPPQLPADLQSMEEAECAKALENFRRRHVHFFYLGFTQRLNPQHWRALEQDLDIFKRRILDHAGDPWEGLNTALQLDLVRISQLWPRIASTSEDPTAECPVSLTKEEAERIDGLDDAHREADADIAQLKRVSWSDVGRVDTR